MVLAMFFFVGMANAETLYATDMVTVASSELDGTYSGEATPLKMNGITLSNSKQYACDFEISNGILVGNFTVGPHDIYLESTSEISGTGTYPVKGYIKLGLTLPFSGTVTVTEADGNNLSFTAVVFLKRTRLESDFEFTGSK